MVSSALTPRANWVRNLATTSPWILVLLATILSFFFSGYVSIYNNNVYHVSILLQTYDLPQFQDDAFVQSLRNFSSGFWLIFAGVGKYVAPKLFLAVWLFITHMAFLASCVHFAQSLGYRDNRLLNLFLLFLCASSFSSDSAVGGGGLMLNSFSHSELADASLVLGFSFGLRQRYGWAAIAVSITFFLNVFMAVWMMPSLALLALYQIATRTLEVRRFVRDGLLGSICGSIFLVLPIVNILQNPEIFTRLDFSYRAYLRSFFPFHFFVSSLTLGHLTILTYLLLILFLTVNLHGRQSRPFFMLSIGAVVLLFIGSVVPLFTDSRMILNLHLIRGVLVIAILVPISLSLTASKWLLAPDHPYRRWLGVGIAGSLLAPPIGWPVAVASLIYDKALHRWDILSLLFPEWLLRLTACAFLAVSVAYLPVRAYHRVQESVVRSRNVNLWERIGTWARRSTATESTFLLLPADPALLPEVGFTATSMRKIWIAWKYGSAVMWSPDYFATWASRKPALSEPKTAEEKLIFATNAPVDYLATECADGLAIKPVHREGGICVYQTHGNLK